MNQLVIKTTPYADGSIVEEIFDASIDGPREALMRRVINTSEAQVREALIQLGWTPPKAKET